MPIKTRRLGQPVNQHDRDLCEGCNQGLCKQSPAKESQQCAPMITVCSSTWNVGTVLLQSTPTYMSMNENSQYINEMAYLQASPVQMYSGGFEEFYMSNPNQSLYAGYCSDYSPVTYMYPYPTTY